MTTLLRVIENMRPDPADLVAGPERRALMREMQVRISRSDFSDAEWAAIQAEAPGMAEGLRLMLDGERVGA